MRSLYIYKFRFRPFPITLFMNRIFVSRAYFVPAFSFYSTNIIDTANEISRGLQIIPRKNENIDKNPRLKISPPVRSLVYRAINWQLVSMEITQCTIRVSIFTRMFIHRMEHLTFPRNCDIGKKHWNEKIPLLWNKNWNRNSWRVFFS